MIIETDTYLRVIGGLRRGETARNYWNCRPFLAFKTLDGLNCPLNNFGVLDQVVIVGQRVKRFAVQQFFARRRHLEDSVRLIG